MKGCKPVERMDIVDGSAAATPYSSYYPSPSASYNPSPGSSSFPSPRSSSYAPTPNGHDGNSLIPWLKNLSSGSSSASSSKRPHLYIPTGSISAPVTPPLSSPSARTPRIKADWEEHASRLGWTGQQQYTLLPSSTPPSPGRQQAAADQDWLAKIKMTQGGPNSPTFSLVSSNPFVFKEDAMVSGNSSRMWTPGQSGTCSPAIAASYDNNADIPMAEVVSDEFAFGSIAAGVDCKVFTAWKGEKIHEAFEEADDDLQLTLGNKKTRLLHK